ncbi:FAD-dependent oxidoreductase [Actinomadura sp. NPDC000600]|uniref:FAD-dependent oxidoreductase n=1 Tax=Actinomadura sp. NPDC000600 TaxID=3154262 RepID=UPI00339B76EF
MTRRTHAVVLGGSVAGMLAAAALARHLDAVTVVERDVLPGGPDHRRGLPQARHAHLLWSGGARVIDKLLPGTMERLYRAGARKISMYQDMVSLTSHGWQHRFPTEHFMIACSRPLLDWTVRDQVGAGGSVTVLGGTEATALLGDAERVRGVRLRGTAEGTVTDLEADLVVDATGRGSPLRRWLAGLGLPEVPEEVVDSGIAYATRIFRAPAEPFPVVSHYADHRTGRPGHNVVLLPIEDGQWIVTVSGTRGGEPPAGEEGFAEFVRAARHPLVSEFLAGADPLTEVRGTRSTSNRRLRYEGLNRWPDGLAVLGDALVAFNPVYGHGMGAAALSAAALGEEISRDGVGGGAARRAQKSIGAVVDGPWSLAVSQDIFYPGCRVDVADARWIAVLRRQRAFADLVTETAIRDPRVGAAVAGVTSLSAPLNSLEHPDVIAALRRGPTRPPLSRPQLTPAELAVRGTVRTAR